MDLQAVARGSSDRHPRCHSSKGSPQAANQTAIYRQLDQWIGAGVLQSVVAEGCSGELTRESKIKFNGWSLPELSVASKKMGFDQIVASVPQKLEAKFGDRVHTLCGDDDALIREHLMALSDLRGNFMFLARLVQYQKDPVRAKNYLEGVIDLYKLPKDTTISQAIKRLGAELSQVQARVRRVIDQRNAKAFQVFKPQKAEIWQLYTVACTRKGWFDCLRLADLAALWLSPSDTKTRTRLSCLIRSMA